MKTLAVVTLLFNIAFPLIQGLYFRVKQVKHQPLYHSEMFILYMVSVVGFLSWFFAGGSPDGVLGMYLVFLLLCRLALYDMVIAVVQGKSPFYIGRYARWDRWVRKRAITYWGYIFVKSLAMVALPFTAIALYLN